MINYIDFIGMRSQERSKFLSMSTNVDKLHVNLYAQHFLVYSYYIKNKHLLTNSNSNAMILTHKSHHCFKHKIKQIKTSITGSYYSTLKTN